MLSMHQLWIEPDSNVRSVTEATGFFLSFSCLLLLSNARIQRLPLPTLKKVLVLFSRFPRHRRDHAVIMPSR